MPAGLGSAMHLRDPAPLAGTARRYREALTATGVLGAWPLDGFDCTGVPVVATLWTDRDHPSNDAHGVGYGATWDEAEVGALGETAERVVLAQALRGLTRLRASYRQLSGEYGLDAIADPLSLTLPAGSSYTEDQILDWVPATRWRTGAQVMIPVEFVATDGSAFGPDPQPLITPITNGLGAGETLARAVGHGLLELLQRDGDTVSFRALDQGVEIDLAGLTDPAAIGAVSTLREAGIEPMVKLAATEFVCVVYAAGADGDRGETPLAASAVGEAAHPDGQAAVTKALLEYASSRARRAFAFGPLERVQRLLPEYTLRELAIPVGPQEDRAVRAMADWVERSDEQLRNLVEPTLLRRTSTVPVSELPSVDRSITADPDTMLDHLSALLSDFDILVVAGESAGIHAAKVIVPGLEVETLSYSRIGERVARRLLDRGSPLVGFGNPNRPTRRQIRLDARAIERLGGPMWWDEAEAERIMGPLYPLYREPRRHAVQRMSAPGPSHSHPPDPRRTT